jgi:hypothetical protein
MYFGHKGDYFVKNKFHQVPKTIQDKRNRIRLQQEEGRKRKAQKAWLKGLPRWKKKNSKPINSPTRFIEIVYY